MSRKAANNLRKTSEAIPKGSEQMKKMNRVQQMTEQPPSPADPQGSWTGKPVQQTDTPVQDADDL